MIGVAGFNAVAGGVAGALVGHVYGSFAHADKKVARLAFAAFFATYYVLGVVPNLIRDPQKQPDFESFKQEKKDTLLLAYKKQYITIGCVIRTLSLAVGTLAFRHFELIGKPGTIAMSLACLYQLVDLSKSARALKMQAGRTVAGF